MALFAVFREQGADWRPGGGEVQDGFEEHEQFIDGLVQAGFVKLAGPLEDGRAMLIVDATDAAQVHENLAADPWLRSDILPVTGVIGWTIRLGEL